MKELENNLEEEQEKKSLRNRLSYKPLHMQSLDIPKFGYKSRKILTCASVWMSYEIPKE